MGRGIFSLGRGCGLGPGGRVYPKAAEAARPRVGGSSLRPKTGTEGSVSPLFLSQSSLSWGFRTGDASANSEEAALLPEGFPPFCGASTSNSQAAAPSERRRPRGPAAGPLPAAACPPFARQARSAFPPRGVGASISPAVTRSSLPFLPSASPACRRLLPDEPAQLPRLLLEQRVPGTGARAAGQPAGRRALGAALRRRRPLLAGRAAQPPAPGRGRALAPRAPAPRAPAPPLRAGQRPRRPGRPLPAARRRARGLRAALRPALRAAADARSLRAPGPPRARPGARARQPALRALRQGRADRRRVGRARGTLRQPRGGRGPGSGTQRGLR